MPRPEVFLDSPLANTGDYRRALFAGVVSAEGAARALLMLAEANLIAVTVSEQVIAETERAVARKLPHALDALRQVLRHTRLRIVRDPAPMEVAAHAGLIAHATDVPIVLAAMQAGVDYLVTFNRRHFIDDPGVAARSGLAHRRAARRAGVGAGAFGRIMATPRHVPNVIRIWLVWRTTRIWTWTATKTLAHFASSRRCVRYSLTHAKAQRKESEIVASSRPFAPFA